MILSIFACSLHFFLLCVKLFCLYSKFYFAQNLFFASTGSQPFFNLNCIATEKHKKCAHTTRAHSLSAKADHFLTLNKEQKKRAIHCRSFDRTKETIHFEWKHATTKKKELIAFQFFSMHVSSSIIIAPFFSGLTMPFVILALILL